jgi:S1-C subfamily serine protease
MPVWHRTIGGFAMGWRNLPNGDQSASGPRRGWCDALLRRLGLALAALCWAGAVDAASDQSSAKLSPQLLDAVVRVHTEVTPGARTSVYLGSEREGSGVIIDADGLIVTIGYLVTEAMTVEVTPGHGKPVPATVVGLDNDSGLALLRTAVPLAPKPLMLGRSADLAEQEIVLAAAFGGAEAAQAARVVSRRQFAGYWEYLLDDAIFTAPPLQNWSGAALLGADGKLLGIGSLIVSDAVAGSKEAGNMFVPIDRLKASMADLLSSGRPGHAAAALARHQRAGDRRAARRHPHLGRWAGRARRPCSRQHRHRSRRGEGQRSRRFLPQALGAGPSGGRDPAHRRGERRQPRGQRQDDEPL